MERFIMRKTLDTSSSLSPYLCGISVIGFFHFLSHKNEFWDYEFFIGLRCVWLWYIRFLAFIDYKINHRSKGKLNFNEWRDSIAVTMENYDYVYFFFWRSGLTNKILLLGFFLNKKGKEDEQYYVILDDWVNKNLVLLS